MTGPEHYREAEKLMQLALSAGCDRGDAADRGFMAEAQVHATLALAAATALPVTAELPPWTSPAGADWRAAISPAKQAATL